MGLFGGDSSSSTTTKKTTNVKTITDESVSDVSTGASGIAVSKRGRGLQTVNVNGLQGEDLAGLVGALSGGQAATAAAVAEANKPIAEIAQALTGTQSEAGSLIRSLALPVALVIGAYLWLRR